MCGKLPHLDEANKKSFLSYPAELGSYCVRKAPWSEERPCEARFSKKVIPASGSQGLMVLCVDLVHGQGPCKGKEYKYKPDSQQEPWKGGWCDREDNIADASSCKTSENE